MSFKPYHYDHIDEFIRYYAKAMERPEILSILDRGITSKNDAKKFCDFIPLLLDKRLEDEKAETAVPVENGSAIISDLHYEAGSFVCDAGYEDIWESMIDKL